MSPRWSMPGGRTLLTRAGTGVRLIATKAPIAASPQWTCPTGATGATPGRQGSMSWAHPTARDAPRSRRCAMGSASARAALSTIAGDVVRLARPLRPRERASRGSVASPRVALASGTATARQRRAARSSCPPMRGIVEVAASSVTFLVPERSVWAEPANERSVRPGSETATPTRRTAARPTWAQVRNTAGPVETLASSRMPRPPAMAGSAAFRSARLASATATATWRMVARRVRPVPCCIADSAAWCAPRRGAASEDDARRFR